VAFVVLLVCPLSVCAVVNGTESNASAVDVTFLAVSAGVVTAAVLAVAAATVAVTAAAVGAAVVTSAVVNVVPSDEVFRTVLDDEPCVVELVPASSASSKP